MISNNEILLKEILYYLQYGVFFALIIFISKKKYYSFFSSMSQEWKNFLPGLVNFSEKEKNLDIKMIDELQNKYHYYQELKEKMIVWKKGMNSLAAYKKRHNKMFLTMKHFNDMQIEKNKNNADIKKKEYNVLKKIIVQEIITKDIDKVMMQSVVYQLSAKR